MQLLGFDVDPINSVQLSNHTGYKYFPGQKLDGKHLDELLSGLRKNDLISMYTHLMVGYLGTKSFVEQVANLVVEMKKGSPDMTFICDPVMGDDRKMYVPRDFIPLYRDKLMPHATLATPNHSEAEWLSERRIKDLQTAYEAAAAIVAKGTKNVVITSLHLPERDDFVDVIAVGDSVGEGKYLHLEVPRQPGKYSGCGDLTTALLLVWYHEHPNDLKLVLEKVFASLQSVIRRTRKQGVSMCGWTELEIIPSRKDLEFPNVIHRAKLVTAKGSD